MMPERRSWTPTKDFFKRKFMWLAQRHGTLIRVKKKLILLMVRKRNKLLKLIIVLYLI